MVDVELCKCNVATEQARTRVPFSVPSVNGFTYHDHDTSANTERRVACVRRAHTL